MPPIHSDRSPGWGFDGYVDPDDGSCLRVWQSTTGALRPQDGPQFNHQYEHSPAAAIVACFNGGSDLGDHYEQYLPAALEQGQSSPNPFRVPVCAARTLNATLANHGSSCCCCKRI